MKPGQSRGGSVTEALGRVGAPAIRSRIVANLSGLYRRYPEWSGPGSGQPDRRPVPGEDSRLVSRRHGSRGSGPGPGLGRS